MVCFCEDVRGCEIRAELAAGYADPELVKRRTGALTGPCQGKYCLSAIACASVAARRRPAGASAIPDGSTATAARSAPGPPRDLVAEEAPSAAADADRR